MWPPATIMPSAPQVMPAPSIASHRSMAFRLPRSNRRSLFIAKNASDRPSGENASRSAPSVSGSRIVSGRASGAWLQIRGS